MVDIKREDITLQDRTKGISADEFAGGSYFYSEAISSGYNTKGFELGYRVSKWALNSRTNGYALAIAPCTSSYGFMAFTRDGRIETENFWNGASDGTGDTARGGAIYAFKEDGYPGIGYLNGIKYGDRAIGIRESCIDIVDYTNAFTPANEILTNTHLSSSTGWTLGTGWTATTSGAKHTPGNTGTLTANISSAGLGVDDYCRCALKINGWTAGDISMTIGSNTETLSDRVNGWCVVTLRGKASTTTLTITPTSTFNGTIEYVNLHKYNMTYVKPAGADLDGGQESQKRPALIWEGDLYVACGSYVNIVSLSDRGQTSKRLVDKNFEIVAMNQQAGNIIIWATNGYDSRQYYWNGVDAVATEVIEWKGLIIQSACGTETISYVLTTSGATSGTVDGYEYRLYAVSGYQRNLIASKLYEFGSDTYLEAPHYNANKKFDFNDVKDDRGMTVFLDSLYIPGCDGVYKYGYDIPGLRSNWTRPIKYDTGATNIVIGQRGHYLGLGLRVDGVNYIANIDNRLYQPTGYLVTEAIYWDKLSSRKALEKIKIGYKNVASTVGNIKVYAIVDDTYFWRFRPTSTPTTRPTVGAVYSVANNTEAEVIDVDETNGVITFRTTENKGSYNNLANTTLTKVSGTGDDSIAVGYNFDNMCLIKTIESENQEYNSDLIFGKDFVNTYLPFWHKIQFVVELNSNDSYISPEVYEISMNSDITDTVL